MHPFIGCTHTAFPISNSRTCPTSKPFCHQAVQRVRLCDTKDKLPTRGDANIVCIGLQGSAGSVAGQKNSDRCRKLLQPRKQASGHRLKCRHSLTVYPKPRLVCQTKWRGQRPTARRVKASSLRGETPAARLLGQQRSGSGQRGSPSFFPSAIARVAFSSQLSQLSAGRNAEVAFEVCSSVCLFVPLSICSCLFLSRLPFRQSETLNTLVVASCCALPMQNEEATTPSQGGICTARGDINVRSQTIESTGQ